MNPNTEIRIKSMNKAVYLISNGIEPLRREVEEEFDQVIGKSKLMVYAIFPKIRRVHELLLQYRSDNLLLNFVRSFKEENVIQYHLKKEYIKNSSK